MSEPPRLLIASQDRGLADAVAAAFRASREQTATAADWPGLQSHLDPESWQLLVLDVAADDERWEDWLPLVKPDENKLLAIMVTASRGAEKALTATRLGFWDYLTKPLDRERLRNVIADARIVLEQSTEFEDAPLASPSTPAPRRSGGARLIGQSHVMQEVYKQVGTAAPQNVDVLVTGESGTGKELICRALHQHSPRKDGPFIAINCAAVPETLLESELFGHEKGSFTGANARRIGRFEQADGGTVLLDEIGDMSPNLQAKLLRLIEDRTFYRVGGNELIQCDTRIVAATNQVLETRMEEGLFRQDLYYRLSVVAIHLPPLREREVDSILIAHNIVARLNRELGRHITSFHPQTVRAILSYHWPGNVRELQNIMKQAMLAAHGSILLPGFLPEHLRSLVTDVVESPPRQTLVSRAGDAARRSVLSETVATASGTSTGGDAAFDNAEPNALIAQRALDQNDQAALSAAVADLERELIRLALVEHRGNISAASRHLGVTRLTLRRKMEQYGLQRMTVVE